MTDVSDPAYLDRLLADAEHRNGDDHVGMIDPDRFFRGGALQAATLRQAVLAGGPIATGLGRTLWYYQDGVWLAGGDAEIRRRCRHLLGQRLRRQHVEGLIVDLAANVPHITGQQPTRWINCRNGLLDWRTGELCPHDPRVPSTYQLGVDWNPSATCPTVDAWLADVVHDDAVMLAWEVIGTAVYADQPFHRAVLLLGPGRNGKGTYLRLLRALIGDEHIASVTLQQLGENRFATADLFGKVANVAGDLDARAILRTDAFKMATGGDLLTAEHKYGHSFQFVNRATFVFSANEAPGTADQSDGFFSRWVVIPFDRLRLAPGDENPSIEDAMHADLEGVLTAAVAGLRRAMERGCYDMPASVAAASARFREDADPIRQFVAERYVITGDDDDRISRHDLYGAYREWCDDNGLKRWSAKRFWPHMRRIDGRIDPDGTVLAGDRIVRGIRPRRREDDDHGLF